MDIKWRLPHEVNETGYRARLCIAFYCAVSNIYLRVEVQEKGIYFRNTLVTICIVAVNFVMPFVCVTIDTIYLPAECYYVYVVFTLRIIQM